MSAPSDDDRGARRERDALEMLTRSHRRLEARLAALIEAADALAGGAVGDDAAAALEVVDGALDFLERSTARHEEDEERSLFPRLARRPELAALLADLSSEHRDHGALHRELRAVRAAWAAAADPGRLLALAGALERGYRAHIEREEVELFPAAREHLGDDERAAMLEEMDERRGHGAGGRRGA